MDFLSAISAHHQVMIQGHAQPLAATVAIANEGVHPLGVGVVPKVEDALSEKSEAQRDCIQS